MKKRTWKRRTALCGLLATMMPAHAALADGDDPLEDFVLYGISTGSNELVKYQFNDSSYEAVGDICIHVDEFTTLDCVDIRGLAYVSGHTNLYGFWSDSSDDLTKMIYINKDDATASIVGQHLGFGDITGATISGLDSDGDLNSLVVSLDGSVNINPNNSPDNEFVLTKWDGSTITRDDLHQNSTTDSEGVYYSGAAMQIRVKPKGNGNQNSMTADGVTYDMSNNQTYVISGANMSVTIRNDHIHTNGKAMGKWWIDFNEPADATINMQGGLFALQDVEAVEDVPVDFDIVDGVVIPSVPFAVKVTVIGAAITYGGSYDLPVTAHIDIGSDMYQPFGDCGKAVSGNVNDDNNPRHYIHSEMQTAGTGVSVNGNSWLKKKSYYSGNKNSHWYMYLSADSGENSPQVLVLRNDDDVPDIEAFDDQNSIVDFIRDYVDPITNTIMLDENQAIYLFELGTTNLSSSAADFQDLVVLVTLAHDPADLDDDDDDDGDAGPSSRLIKINPLTGGYEQIMTMNRDYDSLVADPHGMFYAVSATSVYKLDPFAQTETEMTNLGAGNNIKALESAGDNYFGFNYSDDELSQFDLDSGDVIFGTDRTISTSNLEALIFAPADIDPNAYASFD